MPRKTPAKFSLSTAALASLLLFRSALADSLVTTDGDLLVGTVTRTPDGYAILTSAGNIELPAAKVKRILYDHPPALDGSDAPVARPAAAAPKTPRNSKMLSELIAQGKNALSIKSFTDARDAFTDALAIDPQNATANRGLAYSYLNLSKPAQAVKPLEQLALSQPLDRTLTMTLSAAQLAALNPLRAVKLLESYLRAHPAPLDEPVINALGTALAHVPPRSTKGALFASTSKLYDKLNVQLDDTQPDKKRWGVDWLPADEVTQKTQDRSAAQATLDDTSKKLTSANSKLSSAQEDLSSAKHLPKNNEHRGEKLDTAQQAFDSATVAQQQAQSAFDDATTALAALPAPDFPDAIPLDSVDLSMNPTTVATSIASLRTAATARPAAVTSSAAPAAKSNSYLLKAVASDQSNPAPSAPTLPNPLPEPAATPASPADEAADHGTRYAVAFAIAPDILVTAAAQVEDSTDIEINTPDGKTFKARILRDHHSDGIALLKVDGAKFPSLRLASTVPVRSIGAINCLSFPEVDLFNPVPKTLTGAADAQNDVWTIRLDTSPRLPGGPLIKGGTVIGVELGDRDSDLSAVPAATLKQLLSLTATDAQADNPATDPTLAVMQVTAEH